MRYRYTNWTKFCLPLAVLFCLLLPSLGGITWASNDATDVNDKKLHYIVRHWHADGTHEDDDEYLKEGDPTVTIQVRQKPGETFTGFATAAGHDAVVRERDEENPGNSVLRISYDKDIHLVKVHAFYKDTDLEKEGKDLGSDETEVGKDGIKQYNTAKEGLHTDKTAETVKKNGREFELTLESWFVGDNRANVGMVLDASGSMAFTSNDLQPIKMTDEQIKEYGTMKYIPQNKVNNILNPHYTDNSKLAYSGYTYFVYDPSAETKEYVPIGYWNGVTKTISPEEVELPQKDKLSAYYPFTDSNNDGNENKVDEVKGESSDNNSADNKIMVVLTPDENGRVKDKSTRTPLYTQSKVNAFNGTGKSLDLARVYREKEGACQLDIKPQGKSFSISFAVKGSSEKPVVWIGNKNQIESENQAWYAIYADTNIASTKVSSGKEITTENNDISTNDEKAKYVSTDLPNKNDWNICTYVFEENGDSEGTMVTIYVEGERKASKSLHDNIIQGNGEDVVILLGGSAWQQDYGNGGEWGKSSEVENASDIAFLLDEFYFYDCALSGEEVSNVYNKTKNPTLADSIYAATTPSDKNKTIAKLLSADSNGSGEGWYYVSSSSDWAEITNKNLLTAKRYQGIPKDEVIYNQINEWPQKTKNPQGGNTGEYIYTGKNDFSGNSGDKPAIEIDDDWNGSIIFFIDKEGYLRCFYNAGKSQQRGEENDNVLNVNEESWTQNDSYCSYVYKKEDLMRIKTEALQRALGSFVTKLSEISSKSKVSAVRFSTDNIKDLKTLVLQNWTDNTMDSTGMLGLRRGDRTILDCETESGVDQYNYALTGGTTTRAGLQAYLENLNNELDSKDSADKSLIIFTDGKDNTDKPGAIKLADKLKDEGYKIYCVMLQSAGNQINDSMEFLTALASEDDYVFKANDVDDLTEIFTQEILNRIVNNLPGYTIRDYIDPRFDLVNAEGSVVYLGAGGNIEVDGKKKQINDKDGYKVTTTKTTEKDAAGTVGEEALLFYDSDRDMYYLEWREQTIPGCSVGAERLNVWKTRIRVRAKEDFIGGNALISNGNADSMNMVFHPDDKDKSSGMDDIYAEKDEETGKILNYPSRGFPRTSVNVELLKLELEDAYQKIYMGEVIAPEDALPVLGSKVKEQVYYEYLERYMNWISQQKGESQDLMAQMASGTQIRIPYYYLPDKTGSNQAGKVQPGDQIGWLTYSWTECDEKGVPKSNPTYSSYVTKDTNTRYYQLAVSYLPMTEGERKKETARIVSDKNYSSPKKAVGATQKEIRGLGIHQTDIVSGEIIVEARVLLSDLKYLAQKNGGKLKLKERFSMVRSYRGEESKSELKISFSYTTKKLRELKADKNGYVSVYSAPSDPLPLGKYTLQTMNTTPFQFETIRTKKIEDGNGHFSSTYTKEKKESKYAAPATDDKIQNTVSFYLGVSSSGDEKEVNLDTQLGHARVTYAPLNNTTTKNNSSDSLKDNKLPQERAYGDRAPDTGDRAELVHVLLLMVTSAVLIFIPIMKNMRRKRKS